MALVAAKCPQCGANLNVDETKDACVCEYCGTPFITEKAINNYNSDYGILISNRTFSIKKENNIIYIPLRTFSYI